jgi:hypothetical protein
LIEKVATQFQLPMDDMSLNPYTAVCISIVLLCIPKLQIDSFYAWLGIIMIFGVISATRRIVIIQQKIDKI